MQNNFPYLVPSPETEESSVADCGNSIGYDYILGAPRVPDENAVIDDEIRELDEAIRPDADKLAIDV